MKDKEIFDGFNIIFVKAKGGQSYSAAEKIVGQSIKNPTKSAEDIEKKGKAYYDNIIKTADAFFTELVHCIEKGLDPSADEVQKIIKRHYTFAEQTYSATKEVYKAMAQLYAEHPEFRKQLDPFHSNLATFMAEAMNVFADRKLS
jgi:thiamine kinase-like enzyme